jgi:hypothetical protein
MSAALLKAQASGHAMGSGLAVIVAGARTAIATKVAASFAVAASGSAAVASVAKLALSMSGAVSSEALTKTQLAGRVLGSGVIYVYGSARAVGATVISASLSGLASGSAKLLSGGSMRLGGIAGRVSAAARAAAAWFARAVFRTPTPPSRVQDVYTVVAQQTLPLAFVAIQSGSLDFEAEATHVQFVGRWNMTTTHEQVTWFAGDDWQINATLLDDDGNPFDLSAYGMTGGPLIEWALTNSEQKRVLSTADVVISIINAMAGQCAIMIPAAKTTVLCGGVYTDKIRIVYSGISSTLSQGNILVLLDPWRAYPVKDGWRH